MKVLIRLATQNQEPIEADIPNFDAADFAAKLNGNVMFINLGGNVINRNLIQMITPVDETTA
ncbi:hypothetical protein MKX73_19630 [Solibacillus sp. FSL W7-1436]|uniref:hypothetical protein n=1 Tax=Solibacillus sp. FSL W7-1436 TaxID=2921705 RepID=UPI0030FACA93